MKTATLIALFMIASLLACERATESDYTSELEAKKTADGIGYTLSIPKAVFALSDSLQLTFRVQNESNVSRRFNFANQQQFGFRLTDASGNIALFHPVIVSPATSTFTLQASESKLFSISLLFKDQNGSFINRGSYSLSGYLTDGVSPSVGLQISVQ